MEGLFDPILKDPTFLLLRNLCGLFYVILSFALVFWTWRDAARRGAMAWFWALVVLIFNVAGWAVYLVVRPPEYMEDARERELEIKNKEANLQMNVETCPACLKPVEKDFVICPWCMKKLKKPCAECGKALKLNWKVCPYCRANQ